MRLRALGALLLSGLFALSGAAAPSPATISAGAPAAGAPIAGYRVVRVFPHDPQAFTQGLTFVDGVLYEGTGLNGRSSIRKVKLENGEVLQIQKIDAQYFGEGITVIGNSLFALTWQSGVGFIFDRASFSRAGTFTYSGEGWGLTHDGARLIMSDGTAYLRFLDKATQKETGRLQVRDGWSAGGKAERTRVREGGSARQRVDDPSDRANLTQDGPGHRLDRSGGAADPARGPGR